MRITSWSSLRLSAVGLSRISVAVRAALSSLAGARCRAGTRLRPSTPGPSSRVDGRTAV